MNICVFGDSITWGAFLPFREAWANLLRNKLEQTHNGIAVYDLGIDANTTRDLIERFPQEAKARKPEIIIFAIGVNDSAFKKTPDFPVVELDEFENNLSKLYALAKGFTNKIMFIGLAKGNDTPTNPLARSTTGKCYTKERVKTYDAEIKNFCNQSNIPYVEIFSLLDDTDFNDGLHPNLAGHQKIFQAVEKTLNTLLV